MNEIKSNEENMILCKIYYLDTNFIRKIKVEKDTTYNQIYKTIQELHPIPDSEFLLSYQGNK
jgi:hypothetical protein